MLDMLGMLGGMLGRAGWGWWSGIGVAEFRAGVAAGVGAGAHWTLVEDTQLPVGQAWAISWPHSSCC